ncbi:hypothetical protein HK100_001702 [Physocladia obscura]|uniref:Uncharacterized protein n=1 Tax=Physocladia obscura TaxID=109957 RepID=A0AAD5XFY7_9FUNG|nr:hypothetical protein HK100_001702 [Physocladia obscura]
MVVLEKCPKGSRVRIPTKSATNLINSRSSSDRDTRWPGVFILRNSNPTQALLEMTRKNGNDFKSKRSLSFTQRNTGDRACDHACICLSIGAGGCGVVVVRAGSGGRLED